jgi:hypothetical protein
MRILLEKTYKKLRAKIDEGIAYEQRCEYLERELALAELKYEQLENKLFLQTQDVTKYRKLKAAIKEMIGD